MHTKNFWRWGERACAAVIVALVTWIAASLIQEDHAVYTGYTLKQLQQKGIEQARMRSLQEQRRMAKPYLIFEDESSVGGSATSRPRKDIGQIGEEELRRGMHRASPRVREEFPAFGFAVFPVSSVPNWGAMRSPELWNRSFRDMGPDDFVPLPPYDLRQLTIPISSLVQLHTPDAARTLTAKLTYSTRFFSAYDLDADEFTGTHAGIDIKLAPGTPTASIAGGRIQAVLHDERLGLHIIIEHRHPITGRFFSIYGHLAESFVHAGDDVNPGDFIGTVGMTGKTTAPHLHVQVDLPLSIEGPVHVPYYTTSMPSRSTATQFVMNPIVFIEHYAQAQEALTLAPKSSPGERPL